MSEYIQQLYTDIMMTGMQFGLSDVMAKELAKAMVDRIQNQHAGPVYIPKSDKNRRNERIRLMFNGVNHDMVCKEFGISKATLYRVIKE
jgi:Mor family transcriptional regulator